MRITVPMTKMADIAGCGIENIQALVLGSYPDAALGIDEQRAYLVAGQGFGFGRVVSELLKSLGPPVPARHAAPVRGEPQIAVRVFGDRPDIVAGKPVLGAALAAKFAY